MTDVLRLSSTRIQIAGKFDTQKRYLRAGATGATFPICKGATFVTNGTDWRYSCGAGQYSMTFTRPGNGILLTNNPAFVLVKI